MTTSSKQTYIHRKSIVVLGYGLIAIFSLLIIAITIEYGVRNIFSPQNKYYIWPAHIQVIFDTKSEFLYGVTGPARFKTNSFGIRGEELTSNTAIKIIAFGGSTTEDSYLDSSETWCGVLQTQLEKSGVDEVWVGNAGKSGLSSRDIYLHVKYALPHLPNPDLTLLMVGVNDFLQRLQEDKEWHPVDIEEVKNHEMLFNKAFFSLPWHIHPKYWTSISLIKSTFTNFIQKGYDPNQAGIELYKWRKWRSDASPYLMSLPDISNAILEYKKNLNLILDLLHEKETKPILLTQPALWKQNLDVEEEKLLWLGGIGDYQNRSVGKYYSAKSLRTGLDMFNSALLEVCAKRKIQCIDIDPILGKNKHFFFDGIHFNEAGAFEAGDYIANQIREGVNQILNTTGK